MRAYRRPGSSVWECYHYAGGRRHRKSMHTTDETEAKRKGRRWAKELDELYSRATSELLLSEAIASFLEDCKLHEFAKNTVRGYRATLNRFMGWVGDENVAGWTADTAYQKVSAYLKLRASEIAKVANVRVPIATFFNFLKSRRLYVGENPADGKLHSRRKPRKPFSPEQNRRVTDEETKIIRTEGEKSKLWPVLLLTRWGGLRRGEACSVKWSEVNLEEGYADVVGHEGGRKHPRRVYLAPWVIRQLHRMRPGWLPDNGTWPVWPHCADHATELLSEFCTEHMTRQVSFNDLRSAFVTSSFESELTPLEESKLAGHSPAVADKYYSEFSAAQARYKLGDDPLSKATESGGDGDDGGGGRDLKRSTLRIAK
jgi:integrase